MQWKSAASVRRKGVCTFSDISVVFIRKLHDKVMDTRTFGGFDDLFIGSSGLSVGNIILDGSIKKIDILLYHTDLASKALKSQPADILSVYSNGTAGHIIKSGQERADRGFPLPEGPTRQWIFLPGYQ